MKPQEKVLCSLSGATKILKFLRYASYILKSWIVHGFKIKFTFKSSGIPSIKMAVPRYTSCFDNLPQSHPFIIASLHHPFLLVFGVLKFSFSEQILFHLKAFSHSGKGEKILSQETDEYQLVLYVGQFRIVYFLVLH